MMARVVAMVGFAIAAASGVIACSLAYSDYDKRFQSPVEGGTQAFVTDVDAGGINAVAVTSTDLFYTTATEIKRMPIDGGAVTSWWKGKAISDIASDHTATLAWVTNGIVLKASVATPSQTTLVAQNVGGRSKLVATDTYVAWSTSGGNIVGGVEAWSASKPQGTLTAPNPPDDIAIDPSGVTVFVSGTGMIRYGFDGTVSCNVNAGGLPDTTLLHIIASTATGAPFFAIGYGGSSGPLTRASSGCVNDGAAVDSNVIGVMTDSANVYWVNTTSAVQSELIGGGSRKTLGTVTGSVSAMTEDDAFVYIAAGASIFRIAKP